VAVLHLVLAAPKMQATSPRAFGLPAPSCMTCVVSCGVLLLCCLQCSKSTSGLDGSRL
jgi:hypothetical protein